jgi:hypothetical protein
MPGQTMIWPLSLSSFSIPPSYRYGTSQPYWTTCNSLTTPQVLLPIFLSACSSHHMEWSSPMWPVYWYFCFKTSSKITARSPSLRLFPSARVIFLLFLMFLSFPMQTLLYCLSHQAINIDFLQAHPSETELMYSL